MALVCRVRAPPNAAPPTGQPAAVGAETGGPVWQYVLSHPAAELLLPNETFDAFAANQVSTAAW